MGKDLKLRAKWTDDCQGKKDYDGDILSISTRYWPASGGFSVFDHSQPERGFHELTPPSDAKCSASSSLMLHYDDDDADDYLVLTQKEFEGATFEEVKTEVEKWAQDQMSRASSILQAAFITTVKTNG